MSKPPAWLSREVLPGGFVSDTPLAGGAALDWELEAFAKHGASDRRSLNRFFLTTAGQKILISHYRRGAFFIQHPEEGALMAIALQPVALETVEALEPYLGDVRFYPKLLEEGYPEPPPRQAYRFTCQEVLETLSAYRLPLEVLRKRESLSLWRPFFHQLLTLLQETMEENWPFQRYSDDWSRRASNLSQKIEQELSRDIHCAFPHRIGSDFRRLLSSIETACGDPRSLSGREVSFCKKLLEDTLRKRETLPSKVPRQLPGDDVLKAIETVREELQTFPLESGWYGPTDWLDGLPATIRRKVLKSRLDSLERLRELGLLNSIETLAELAPQVLSGVFDCPLLSRSYRAFSLLERANSFESLPWIASMWRTPDGSRIKAAACDLLECWWNHFGHRIAPPALRAQLETAARWLGHDWDQLIDALEPQVDLSNIIRKIHLYLEEQQALKDLKPYQKMRRNRRVREAEEQLDIYRGRLSLQLSPSSKSVSTREPDL